MRLSRRGRRLRALLVLVAVVLVAVWLNLALGVACVDGDTGRDICQAR